MNTSDFLEQFSLIEIHLFSLVSDKDAQRGFLPLLISLENKNLVSKEVLKNIKFLIKIRNGIVSSRTEVSIDASARGKIDYVKRQLHL